MTPRLGDMCRAQALLHIRMGIGRIWSKAMKINSVQLYGEIVILKKMQNSFNAPEIFIFGDIEDKGRENRAVFKKKSFMKNTRK